MAEFTTLGALQALHRELVAFSGGYGDSLESLDNEFLLQTFEKELDTLWEHPSKKEQSRSIVKSGTENSRLRLGAWESSQTLTPARENLFRRQ